MYTRAPPILVTLAHMGLKIQILGGLLLGLWLTQGLAKTNDREQQVIDQAVHFIQTALGREHPLSETLYELHTHKKIVFVDAEELPEVELSRESPHAHPNAFVNPLTRHIYLSRPVFERILGENKGALIEQMNFWTLTFDLLHEAIHLTYYVGDPEAGRLAGHFISKFFPRPPGPGVRQPFVDFEALSCPQLRRIQYMMNVEWELGLNYALNFTLFRPLFGKPGLERFSEVYYDYAFRREVLLYSSHKSQQEKEERLAELDQICHRDIAHLSREWGIPHLTSCLGVAQKYTYPSRMRWAFDGFVHEVLEKAMLKVMNDRESAFSCRYKP